MDMALNNMTAAPLPTVDDPRWAQVVARDKEADGRFWYSVATTGIYCRPSCPSRGANPKNVGLHATLGNDCQGLPSDRAERGIPVAREPG
jgi:AraC family transcriptional regulator of adaptative response/methylated-DNA-[protein]-cysteine methyltransferase